MYTSFILLYIVLPLLEDINAGSLCFSLPQNSEKNYNKLILNYQLELPRTIFFLLHRGFKVDLLLFEMSARALQCQGHLTISSV